MTKNNSQTKIISMFILIFTISFLIPQIAEAKLVKTKYSEYTGKDGKSYVVTWYKDDVSGEKFSEISVNGAEPYLRSGYHEPKVPTFVPPPPPLPQHADMPPSFNFNDFDMGGLMVMHSMSSPSLSPSSAPIIEVEENTIDINYRINSGFIEIQCEKDIYISVCDPQTGKMLVSDVLVKDGGWHTINMPSNIDRTRAYTIVAVFNGQIAKTLSFYFN